MAKTYEQLKQQAEQIRDEIGQGENTAERVGNMHLDHLKFSHETKEEVKQLRKETIESDITLSMDEYQKLVEKGAVDPTKNYYIFEE